MSFPPAHMLVAAGLADVAASARGLPRRRAWALAACLSVLPDLDVLVGVALGRGFQHHGTFSHSIVATVIATLVVAAAARRWWVVAFAGYGSHLLVDLLDENGRTNVQLAWPFSREQAVAIDKVFPRVEFVTGHGPGAAFRSLFTPQVMEQIVLQTLLGAVFCALLMGVGWVVRRRAGSA